MIRNDHDSDGNEYEVWKQQQESSCGIASILMAKSLVSMTSLDQSEWKLGLAAYSSIVGQTLSAVTSSAPAPQSFDPSKYDANSTTYANALASGGFSADQIERALIGEGFTVNSTMPSEDSEPFDANLLGDGKAAVVLVQWDKKKGEKGSAGHFMVAARKTSWGTIVILDPWDGKVNERPNKVAYKARYGRTGKIVAVIYLS